MRLWAKLYALIWVVLLEVWLGFTPIAPPVPVYVHIALGVLIVGLAYSNFVALRDSRTVGRLKRTARATFALSLLMAVLGVAIYFNVGSSWIVAWGLSIGSGIRFLHFVNAMAILSQTSATAVVYDVWEEKEFLKETGPGEIPPPPSPAEPRAP